MIEVTISGRTYDKHCAPRDVYTLLFENRLQLLGEYAVCG